MLKPLSRVLMSVGLLCGLYATSGGAPAASDPPSATAELAIGTGDHEDVANLTCHGQVCEVGEQCCSCKISPTAPLQFFCGTPDFCPHGTICTVH